MKRNKIQGIDRDILIAFSGFIIGALLASTFWLSKVNSYEAEISKYNKEFKSWTTQK